MIITVIILVMVFVPVLWVVFVPVSIRVNTANGLYEVKQTGTINMSLHPGEVPLVRMRLLGFPIDIQRTEKAKGHEKKKQTRVSTRKGKSIDAWLSLCKCMMNGFRRRRFICKVDFDDVVVNAQLFPVGYFMSRGSIMVNVNFEKKYLLDIWIQAHVHRMLWAFIRFYLTK